jgi:hypothetical protein
VSESAEKIKSLKTVRGKDLKVRYTQDNFEDALINQRQYFDDNGDGLTPVTSLLLNRQVTGANNPTIDRLGKSEPRYISACFGSPRNSSGQSEFKILIPYAPGDPNQVEQIKEIRDYISPSQFLVPQSALALTYHGENFVP